MTARPVDGTRPEPSASGRCSPRFEVIVVSYHSRPQVQGLLAHVPDELPVVIVDNASGADHVEGLLAGRPQARYLDGGGRGFARAANLGARTSEAEFLVFANPDSRPTMDTWEALVRDLEADPGLGSCAATTVDEDGHVEIGVGGWEPSVARVAVHSLGLHKVLPRSGVYARPHAYESVELDWLSGACLAVRRQTFVQLGGFDEDFYVYNEDMSFGRRVRTARLRQRLRTDLLVPHRAGSSGAGSQRMLRQRGASMALYLSKYNSAGSAAVMGAVMGLGTLARVPLCLVQGRREWARLHLAYVAGLVTRRSPFNSGAAPAQP